ncbi:SDR family oxidoreductase [Variovorax sp. VNK109]|uniref:SDR family oxidoreductase n=1 Tax=Variovorax sp. VNK109 TaxID=3400919 RepID=UPI003C02C22D
MRGLDGKVAIVTGAATLLGAEVSAGLARRGVHVLLADVNEADGRAAAERIGTRARFCRTDLRDDAQIAQAVAMARSLWGGLDFVVNLATVYMDNGIESPRADWSMALDTNITGAAMLLQAAVPAMIARGGGSVVNFGSISAHVAQPGRWVYPACKAAMLQLTRNAAADLAQHNIRVNTVSPGWVWSSAFERRTGGDRATADAVAAPLHMLGRMGDPAEVADAVAFLLSDEARFITAAELPVDGGYAALGPEQGISVAERFEAHAAHASPSTR